MKEDIKKMIRSRNPTGGFIKTSDSPLTALSSEQKVLLNRKGNVMFNEGDVNAAQRLFLTTGYSDGLSRIGDAYKKSGDDLSALKFYVLAHSKAKSEPIIERIAQVVSTLLKDEGGYDDG